VKIVALIKSVPDTEAKVKINADASNIDEQGVKYVMNPYDEYAVEEALLLKEKTGDDTTVTVVSLGPDRVVEALRTALAMGADEAIHISDPAFEGGDAQSNARVLAEVIKPIGADLVLGGRQGIDFDSAQTCAALAEYLDMPQALIVTDLTLSDDKQSVTVKRRVEGADEVIEMSLPAVVTCEKGLNEPRYPSLKGIMQAKKKPIDIKKPEELGLDTEELDAPQLTWEALELPPARQDGRIIDGTAEEAARELARLLREEAKVI